MFKSLTCIFTMCILGISALQAQISTPQPSPSASFTQMVGLTTVSAEYSRPGVKGRTIFAENGLVPFGKVWRTGANSATKLSFSDDVKLEGKALKAGSYAVLTKPGAASWDVHFYAYESGNFGSYLEKTPDVVVTVTPQQLPFTVENFFITVGNLHNNGADLQLVWSNVVVPIKLSVPTQEKAMATIEKTLAGPTTGDYYAAGAYLFAEGKDLEKALMYVQKATSNDKPAFWQVRTEAEIMAAMGKYKEAIKVAEHSKKLAMDAKNMDYVKINTDNIKKWSSM